MDPMQALTQARRALKDMREAQEQGDTQAQLGAGHVLADAFESLNTWLAAAGEIQTEEELTGVVVSYAESCDHDTVRASLAGIPAGHVVTATLRDGSTVDAETLGFMTTARVRPCSPTTCGTRTPAPAMMSCRCHWTTSSRSASSDRHGVGGGRVAGFTTAPCW